MHTDSGRTSSGREIHDVDLIPCYEDVAMTTKNSKPSVQGQVELSEDALDAASGGAPHIKLTSSQIESEVKLGTAVRSSPVFKF